MRIWFGQSGEKKHFLCQQTLNDSTYCEHKIVRHIEIEINQLTLKNKIKSVP